MQDMLTGLSLPDVFAAYNDQLQLDSYFQASGYAIGLAGINAALLAVPALRIVRKDQLMGLQIVSAVVVMLMNCLGGTQGALDALKAHGAAPHMASYAAKSRPHIANRVVHILSGI